MPGQEEYNSTHIEPRPGHIRAILAPRRGSYGGRLSVRFFPGLRQALGHWVHQDPLWPWYFCPAEGALYKVTAQGCQSFECVRPSRRLQWFSSKGPSSLPPHSLHRATVSARRNIIVLTGYAPILCNLPSIPRSFHSYLAQSPLEEQWCYGDLVVTGNELDLIEAIRNGSAIAVSDGSYSNSYDTAGLTIT